ISPWLKRVSYCARPSAMASASRVSARIKVGSSVASAKPTMTARRVRFAVYMFMGVPFSFGWHRPVCRCGYPTVRAKLGTNVLFPSRRREEMAAKPPLHVSLPAVPGSLSSPITGLYELLTVFPVVAEIHDGVPAASPFEVEIVGAAQTTITAPSGLPITIQRSINDIVR